VITIGNKARKGFTLIEILVVVTIIGILASITLLGLGPARRSAQDTAKIANLRSVQSALEVYFNKNGTYPDLDAPDMPTATGNWDTLENAVYLNARLPHDPGDTYQYESAGNGTTYVIGVNLTDVAPTTYRIPRVSQFDHMLMWCGDEDSAAGKNPYCVVSP
jgi:prepilin-type N-terminal cleavage/methylation domain-containing protein